MDETELVVPWEKQHRLLSPSDSQAYSPVRKSYSYAGVPRNIPGAATVPSQCSFSVVNVPVSSAPPGNHEEQSALGESAEPSGQGGHVVALDTGTTATPSAAPAAAAVISHKISTVSDPMAAIFQAGAKMKFVPFFARQGAPLPFLQSTGSFSSTELPYGLISQEEASLIDQELFTEYAFSVDQLMELAGYACAVAIQTAYPRAGMKISDGGVLVCCGPGNNGGDGLVCARHLKLFGYKPTVYYPRAPTKELYKRLVTQCEKMGIAFLSYIPSDVKILESSYDLIVDALFGFGYHPPMKPDFAEIVQRIASLKVPLASIDVPSGWEVNEKTESEDLLQPDCLISLTAPKLCALRYNGRYHFLGGRFVPPILADKYKLGLPQYPGASPVVILKGPQNGDSSTPHK